MADSILQLLAQAQQQPITVPIAPAAILVLCIVAGVGTVLLLPSRREVPLRKIGGIILIAATLVFAALLIRWKVGPAAGVAGMSTSFWTYFWIFSAIALFGAVRVVTHTKPVYSALYFVLTVFASAGLFLLVKAEFMAAALILIYAGAILITYVFVIMLAAEATGPASSMRGGSLAGMADVDAVSRDPVFASIVGFALMGVILFVIFDKYQTVQQQTAGQQQLLVQEQTALQQQTAGQQQTAPSWAGWQKAREQSAAETAEIAAAHPELVATNLTVQPVYSTPASGATQWDFGPSVAVLAQQGPTQQQQRPTQPQQAPTQQQGPTQQLGEFLFTKQLVNLELAGLILTLAMVGAIVIARRQVYVEATDATPIETRNEVVLGPATPIDDDPHSIPVYGTTNPRQKAYPET